MELSPDLLNLQSAARIARCALNDPAAVVSSWDAAPIAYASVGSDSRGLFRVGGTASASGKPCVWSAVLKVFLPLGDGSTTPVTSSHYWRRESLAYTSGLLASLREGLRVPLCYGAQDMPDGSLWLWLEEMRSDAATPWPLSRFRLAAYHLGLLNGSSLVSNVPSKHEWLSKGMTRVWAEENAYTIDLIAQPEVWESALLRAAFPHPVRNRLLRLWEAREACYERLDALPQTLCHHDAGHRNLFSARSPAGMEQTVLIDWELVGYGAIGEELANLFAPALINFEVASEQAENLAHTLLEGYTEGLRAAGWQGDGGAARLGFAIAVVFRWVFASAGWPAAIVSDSSGRAEKQTLEQWGKPLEQVYRQWAGLTYYLLDLAEEVA